MAGGTLRVGMVAGEASGDALGASLIAALRRHQDDLEVEGIGGPGMSAAGCDCWYPSEDLSVMGLTELARHLPRLWRLRRRLLARWLARPPDVMVGIDAPDFNLALERRLRLGDVPTVHYVSPSVWAWRQGRVKKIARAADLVLCLLPFEPDFYTAHGVDATFIGHPLADTLAEEPDKTAARRSLGLDEGAGVVAILPGSRAQEIQRLGPAFIGAMRWLGERRPGLVFVAPMASTGLREQFSRQLGDDRGPGLRLLDGGAQQALAACDVALIASGTATLEAALTRRPLVMAYRLSPLTAWLAVRFGGLRLRHFSLPNLIAGKELVPEFLMDAVTGEALGAALLGLLDDPARVAGLRREFDALHEVLGRDASARAAESIMALLARKRGR